MRDCFWFRYSLTLLSVGLATWLSVALRFQLEYTRSIFFIPAVVVSAWFGGLGGGLLASVLAFLAIGFFMVPPHNSMTSFGNNIIELLVFLIVAILFSYMTARRRTAEESLRQANKNQSEFLNILAHELRNPLSPIRNAVEVVRRAPGDEDLIGRQCCLIERQVIQMSRLLNDLLDLSRLGLGKIGLNLEQHDLRVVVEHCVEAAGSTAEQCGLELRYLKPATGLPVESDSVRLEQIFGNLINNACKYTERGGWIEIRMGRESTESNKVFAIVRVCDNGMGIAADLLPHIFDCPGFAGNGLPAVADKRMRAVVPLSLGCVF